MPDPTPTTKRKLPILSVVLAIVVFGAWAYWRSTTNRWVWFGSTGTALVILAVLVGVVVAVALTRARRK